MFDTNVETGKEKPNGTVWKESKERREEKGRGGEKRGDASKGDQSCG